MWEAMLKRLILIIKNYENMNHSDKFLSAFGTLLCDYASLADCTYTEVCSELKISPKTYSKV